MLDVTSSIPLVFSGCLRILSHSKWLSNPNRSSTRKSCASRCGRAWSIVTSMRETRLYYKGAHQQAYERFETVRLANR